MGIFEPYRAIGYIAGNVPFSVQRLGTETFVTVSIGKAFQVYNCAKLNLVISGPQLPKKIRALACYREFTFAAYGKHIAVVRRAHLVATCNGHSSKINQLLVFGDYLISTDIKGSVYIWPFKGLSNSISPVGHICLESSFTPSCLMHPDTYLNKVVIGSQEGSFQLWNISTKKKLYDFKGWDSAICCCVASPALHVVALGCADGKVHVHNIYTDEKLFTFAHSTRGAVTALSFCTDGRPLLASGDSSGVICLWNLEKNRLHSVIGEAHNGSIISLYFFPREPVLMSSSADNSIKMWIFDTSDGDARLLRFRSGHSAPPLCIKFYANGRHILSAGQDRAFRLFSIIQDQQSKELSQRHISKRAKKLKLKDAEIKLKPVIAFDVAEIRERDWCNVVTCHLDTAKAYVWRLQNFVIGEHILTPCPGNSKPAKSCAISACGNFAIIGNAGGWIERFNLQSGISRGSYVDTSGGKLSAHEGEVIGIACDSTNTILISAGFHGDIKVWDFKKQTLKFRMETGCTLVKVVYHRYNGLLAVMADDLLIRLFDIIAQRIVRKFEGHTDRITDACFSEDGKWFLTSGMDSTVRVWDLILARVIDVLNVDVPVISLSLSPGMDILATAHVDQNGIYLWVNQEMFSVPNKAGSYGRIKEDASSLDESTEMQDDPSLSISCDHLLDLVTLSMLPKTQWQSLINLDLIKARNKPIEPPKKPEKTPFFLPSIPSLSGDIVFKPVVPAEDEEDKQNTELEKKQEKRDIAVTQFLQLLESSSREGNFATFTDYVKGLSASSLDMEFRMLQIIDDVDEEDLMKRPETHFILLLIEYFIQEISRGSNFEFIQAQIRLFLTIHGETIRRQAVVRDKAQKLLEIHSAVWQKLDKMFQSARCTMTFLSNSQF